MLVVVETYLLSQILWQNHPRRKLLSNFGMGVVPYSQVTALPKRLLWCSSESIHYVKPTEMKSPV
jgi:hypothetical protein